MLRKINIQRNLAIWQIWQNMGNFGKYGKMNVLRKWILKKEINKTIFELN